MAAGCGLKTVEPSVKNKILIYDSFAYVLAKLSIKFKYYFLHLLSVFTHSLCSFYTPL